MTRDESIEFVTAWRRLERWGLVLAEAQRCAGMLRLQLMLSEHEREPRYRPDQPRVPAGNPDGGEWTRVGGRVAQPDTPQPSEGEGSPRLIGENPDSAPAADRAPIRIAQSGDSDAPLPGLGEDSRRYTVDLVEEDRLGGHAYRDHVGKTDEELLAEIYTERVRQFMISTSHGAAESSFLTLTDANNFVNRVLEENKDTVDQVAAGELYQATLNKRFGYRTGKEAAWRDPNGFPYMRPTYFVRVVIRSAPGSKRGYRVLTAFPYNLDRTN